MIGVVACGGLSTRMRSDKGLINSEGKVWAKILRDKFFKISIPSFLSINQNQIESYLHHFKDDDLIVDNSSLKVHGPLLGLLSVHLKYPDQDLMMVACDMINMNEIILKKLSDAYNSSEAEAIVFKGERVEPLCGIYSSRGLRKIHSIYQETAISNYSMMHALEKMQTSYIAIPEEWEYFFKNFNSVEDLSY